jgi:hypothetical protein
LPLRIERRGHPITNVEDWFHHARPLGGTLQWRDGRSAKELAKAWCREDADAEPPRSLRQLLSANPAFANLEYEVAFPEHRVRFDDIRGEPRNTDLAVLCRSAAGNVALSIEAKADEPFGRSMGEEIVNAAAQWAFEEQAGKLERIRNLAGAILSQRRPGQASIGELRYQLLTAIAGGWAFAAEQNATVAILVVHEFLSPALRPHRLAANRADLAKLVSRLPQTGPFGLDALMGPMPVPPSPFWVGVSSWYLGHCHTDVALAVG